MEITGEYLIQASREEVWRALNDLEVLKQAIPGCEAMEQVSENEFTALVRSKIGPVKAKFNSKISLANLRPPEGYSLIGEGQGGVAGFASGQADVQLSEQGAETLLQYKADFKIGGKLAQVGSRLVAGATRKTADQFFANFAEILNAPESSGTD